MSVNFSSGSSQYISYGTTSDFDNMTAMSVALWVYPTTLSGTNRNAITRWKYAPPKDLGWIIIYSNVIDSWHAEWAYNDTNNTDSVDGPSGADSADSDRWVHLGSVWQTTTRNLYIDGSPQTADTNSRTSISDVTEGGIHIGSQIDASNYFDGNIEHAAIWDVALSTAEFQALAGGVHPMRIRPGNLKFYVPLWNTTHINSTMGKVYAGTLNNTPTTSALNAPVEPFRIGALRGLGVQAAGGGAVKVDSPLGLSRGIARGTVRKVA